MSRGIGKTQQAILNELADTTEYLALTVTNLAGKLGLPMNQTRRAARALEQRELVIITKECTDWKGQGEYGRLVPKKWSFDNDKPTAVTVHKGDPIPHQPGWVAVRDIEYYHAGTPTVGLLVWLPENRIAWLERPGPLGSRFNAACYREEYEALCARYRP
jgi:hypothetical protein